MFRFKVTIASTNEEQTILAASPLDARLSACEWANVPVDDSRAFYEPQTGDGAHYRATRTHAELCAGSLTLRHPVTIESVSKCRTRVTAVRDEYNRGFFVVDAGARRERLVFVRNDESGFYEIARTGATPLRLGPGRVTPEGARR